MAWQTPKTNWTPVDGVSDADINRIEGNTAYLKTYAGTKTIADINYYVNPTTGNDANDGVTAGTPFRTIQYAINLLPEIIDHNIIINLVAGTYNEAILIEGFVGKGVIKIQGGTTLALGKTFIIGSLVAKRVACGLSIQGLSTLTTTTQGFAYTACQEVWHQYCSCMNTSLANYDGVYFSFSKGYVSMGEYNYRTWGITSLNNSQVFVDTNVGANNTYGMNALRGGIIYKHNAFTAQPTGTNDEYEANGGQIISSGVISSDLNNLVSNGWYYANNSANRPSTTNGYVEVRRLDNTYILQTFYYVNGPYVYTRVKNNGTWTSWSQVMTQNVGGSLNGDLILANTDQLFGRSTGGIAYNLAMIDAANTAHFGTDSLTTKAHTVDTLGLIRTTAATDYRVWDNGNSAVSKAANGYQKFGSGLILQWGSVSAHLVNGTGSGSLTFPIVFPASAVGTVATVCDSTGVSLTDANVAFYSPTNSGISFYVGDGQRNSTGDINIRWFSLGW